MKRALILMVVLACMGFGEAYANYALNFTSNDGRFVVKGQLVTQTNGNGPLTVTDGIVAVWDKN
jgi:hypothetical protein